MGTSSEEFRIFVFLLLIKLNHNFSPHARFIRLSSDLMLQYAGAIPYSAGLGSSNSYKEYAEIVISTQTRMQTPFAIASWDESCYVFSNIGKMGNDDEGSDGSI